LHCACIDGGGPVITWTCLASDTLGGGSTRFG